MANEETDVLFQNAPVGMCLLRERTILNCNRRFEEIFGYGEGELENQSVRLLYPSDEMFQYIGDKYGHFFEKNTWYRDERPMLRKDKSLIWCIVTGKVLFEHNPRFGAVWVVQDISEHKELENELKANVEKLELVVHQRTLELREYIDTLNAEVETRKKAEEIANVSQHKYHTLFHMLPIGISLTTEDGRIVEANRVFCEMVGVEDAVSMNWRDLPGRFFLHDGSKISKDRFAWLINEHQERKVSSVEVGMLPRRGGKPRWLSTNTSLLSLSGQRMIVAVFTDITYRKRIEELERLRHAELTRLGRINSMAEMATAIAHQLGQPLVTALNYLNGCRLRLQQGRPVDEISNSIDLSITYLEQAGEVLRRVRDFVCKHTPEKLPEDINEIIHESVHMLEFEARRHGVAINFSLAENLPLIPLNKVEIQQVLFNLLKNGMEAMSDLPEDQRILSVGNRISRNGSEIKVFIIDRGAGVGSAYASRLFDPLFTTKPDGIGMGLTICRCIIESHGGKLCFSKVGKQGSKFQFTLPMTKVGNVERINS
jgi:PAS domain S-box-containing protein